MAERSIRLELSFIKLYPKLINSASADLLVVDNDKTLDLLFILKKSILHKFYLNDMIATDLLLLKSKKRFEVRYSLISYVLNYRLTIKTLTNSKLNSVNNLFKSSIWLEREIWDLFGVFFLNAFDLRRILTDYGFNGHPFRKDFPVTGYYELRYSEKKKRVISLPVNFQQELRVFSISSPWTKNTQI